MTNELMVYPWILEMLTDLTLLLLAILDVWQVYRPTTTFPYSTYAILGIRGGQPYNLMKHICELLGVIF